MTKEEIILMARQTLSRDRVGFWAASMTDLEDFADLVAQAEREACAKTVEGFYGSRDEYAAAIRARSQHGV